MEKKSITQTASRIRGKYLGKGSFGTVTLATNESDGAVFAVKSVDLATCLPSQLESLENEITILRSLSSPYVVEYLGDDVTYESPITCYRNLHLEYLAGGTVADEAIVKSRLADVEEKNLRWHTRCLVSGLKYVHSEGIVHCDVKGKNVLVVPDLTSVKLADFGSAMVEIENEISSGDRCRSKISPRGSPLWMAPEVIRGEYQGPESDVWSLGCTVIEMVTGKPAWEDQGFNSLNRIANSEESPELPSQLSELGKDFVNKCLQRDRDQRWSCDQLLQHPFIASASAANVIGESSPRCVLDFAGSKFEKEENTENFEASARERIGKIATEGGVIWESDGWVTIRGNAPESRWNCAEGTSTEYPEAEGTSSVYSGSMRITQGIDMRLLCNTVVWQCGNYQVVKGLTWSSSSTLCCHVSCCRGRSQKVELTVEKRELKICYGFCNLLLQLFLCNLRIFHYRLMVFFKLFLCYYILCISFSTSIFLVMRFEPFLFVKIKSNLVWKVKLFKIFLVITEKRLCHRALTSVMAHIL